MNEILILMIWGALGGFAWHIFYSKGNVALPYWQKNVVHLGFLLNVILGAIFGLLTPYGLSSVILTTFPGFPVVNNPMVAWFAGLGSIVIVEKFIETVFRR